MTENTGTNAGRSSQKASQKDARAARLQAQLRANLQKRKGQTRLRVAEASENDNTPDDGNQS